MQEISVVEVPLMDMLSMSIVVLFVGMYLNRKIHFLKNNYIPPAVTGGLLFATGITLLYSFADMQLEFDMRLRDILLLVFFSTIGLSARFKTLAAGGKALLVLTFIAGIFLILQNSVGVAIALSRDVNPGWGLIAGSIPFAGGHGTAIAWGQVAEEHGLKGAASIGLAFATFGLVAGGLIGGPIARLLIERRQVSMPAAQVTGSPADSLSEMVKGSDGDWLFNVLMSILVLTLCVSLGDIVNRNLSGLGLRLPGFLTSMMVGIVIINTSDLLRKPLKMEFVEKFSALSLNIFLAMSMMAIQLWTLAAAAEAIFIVLVLQVLLMTLFAIYVVFRAMGSDYDAVVIASGFAGMGLGATPVAIANMSAITSQYGTSTKAFLVVPLVGAFFIDILNAGTIKLFIRIIQNFLS